MNAVRRSDHLRLTIDDWSLVRLVFKKVEEESDETAYWLEILVESGLVPQEQIAGIYKETNEILAMTVASLKTLRNRKSKIVNPKS
ncbi:MAG: four helix bundle protein [Chloroflexi bacterium]|nr:four helix bundle protein [Chloroflexota bacterium]